MIVIVIIQIVLQSFNETQSLSSRGKKGAIQHLSHVYD
ncbi:hypothetical protein PLIP_a2407 [Pseudoalteromonas lipolytica LMEB 39]|nr:hypothetical protein [Pseudoalteromonas lipolytica LMEB 39]